MARRFPADVVVEMLWNEGEGLVTFRPRTAQAADWFVHRYRGRMFLPPDEATVLVEQLRSEGLTVRIQPMEATPW